MLSGLVNKSLVDVDENETGSRYRFLETIRQYAREKLFESGEGEAARDRHADYYDRAVFTPLGLVSIDGGIGIMSMRPIFNVAGWVGMVEQDIDNLRAAVDWAVARNTESGLLMAATLALALSAARLGDGTPALREAMTALDTLPLTDEATTTHHRDLRTLAYLALANHNLAMGDTVTALAKYSEAERLARLNHNRGLLARALVQCSLAAAFMNNDLTIATAHEAAALFRELGDSSGETQAIGQLATFYLMRGDTAKAMPLADQAKAMLETSDDPLTTVYWYLGAPQMARAEGDIATAERLYREGAEIFRRMKNRGFALRFESELAHMLRQEGRIDDARPVYRQAIREWQELGRRAAVANMLENFALIARAERQFERAARLFGAAEAIRDEIQVDMTPWEREEYLRETVALRDVLPAATLSAEWAAGRAMTLDEAVDFAVE